MQNALLLNLTHAIAGQSGAAPLGTSDLVFLALTLIAGAVAYVATSKVKKLQTQAADLNGKITNKTKELKESNSSRKKLQGNLDEKNDKLQKLKKDLASQRKKTHAAQEDSKKIRDSHRNQLTTMEKERTEKPAFSPGSSAKSSQAPKPHPTATPAAPAPAQEAAPAPATESDVIKALRNEVARAQDERDKSVKTLTNEKDTYNAARNELKELKFRVERYRRVDIMTRNQLELANDKLLTLGRQYYDSVSELAAARGDVTPPKPKTLRDAEAEAAKRALESTASEATDEVLEPASQRAPVSLKSVDIETLNREAPVENQAAEAVTDSENPAEEATAENEAAEAVEAANNSENPAEEASTEHEAVEAVEAVEAANDSENPAEEATAENEDAIAATASETASEEAITENQDASEQTTVENEAAKAARLSETGSNTSSVPLTL